jgi:trehalose/maltose transport system permease protein
LKASSDGAHQRFGEMQARRIAAWNEFLFALTFTLSNEERTVPVAIALITGASQHELPWGNIMAASVIVTLPLVVLVLVFQRKIVAGLTAGAVKG